MNTLYKLIKSILIIFIVSIIINFLIINPVLAKNISAGLGVGTKIATPNGDIAVENLQEGDRVLGYNFKTHRIEENTVKEIDKKSSLSSYLINGKTKVASPNLIYQRTVLSPEIVRLNKVKPWNKLFGRKSYSVVVNSIEQLVKSTDIYQIFLDNEIGNIYADDILIHGGSKLPPYFKNHHVDCKPGTPYSKQCANITLKTLPGFLAALGIIFVSLALLDLTVEKIFKNKLD